MGREQADKIHLVLSDLGLSLELGPRLLSRMGKNRSVQPCSQASQAVVMHAHSTIMRGRPGNTAEIMQFTNSIGNLTNTIKPPVSRQQEEKLPTSPTSFRLAQPQHYASLPLATTASQTIPVYTHAITMTTTE